MRKLLFALLMSIASISYADIVANKKEDRSAVIRSVVNSENPQVKKRQDIINKNKNKPSSENARRTKSKNKGMHIKDDVTGIKQNEPGDAEEINISAPTANQP